MQPLAATSYIYWKIISSGGISFDVFLPPMVPADMFPHTINRRLFRLHNPALRKPPQKAVDVFSRTIRHIKIQGLPSSQPPKSTFSAGGKSP
jgi:hypothetical protein